MISLATGGERGAFSLPHFLGWQGHANLLHHPRAPKCPLKSPPAPWPKALDPGPSASQPPATGPPAP
jgi:hypothetical protein